jgi:hypothetical protein
MKRHARHVVRNLGHDTADLAKRVGGGTAALGRRVGGGTVDLARKVGPRRAIIGIAAIGAVAAGTIVLVRYLQRRRELASSIIDYDAIEEPTTGAGVRARNASRDMREAMRPSGY